MSVATLQELDGLYLPGASFAHVAFYADREITLLGMQMARLQHTCPAHIIMASQSSCYSADLIWDARCPLARVQHTV